MAEPKVRMKFGTYKSATEALGKNLTANRKDSYRVSQEDGERMILHLKLHQENMKYTLTAHK